MLTIFLATRNKAKYSLMKKYCSLIKCNFKTPYEIQNWPKFEETGKTMLENAELKAINWSFCTSDFVLSDDCGFDIPALKNGWEKVLSKRNLGNEETTDVQRRENLFKLMKDFKGEDRRVYWTEAIALAKDGKLIGSICIDNPNPSYITEKLEPGTKITPGEFLSCIEYKPMFGKVYTALSDTEIEENERVVLKSFREFIKEKIEAYNRIN